VAWRHGLLLLSGILTGICSVPTVAAADDPVFIADQQLTVEPKYARLAYRPAQSTRLLDVPDTFWTVQLIALSSKQALETYARRQRLGRMSAARIARNGQLYYALLLGVYETEEIAREATVDLPEPLNQLALWVRPLVSLQRAILEGNRLAADSGP
jgi:septal ring-binding cell division protein DamX